MCGLCTELCLMFSALHARHNEQNTSTRAKVLSPKQKIWSTWIKILFRVKVTISNATLIPRKNGGRRKKKLCGHFGVPHYNFINDVVVKMRNTQHLENYFKPKVVRQRKCSIKRVFVKRFVLFSKRHAICFVPSHRWVRHMKKNTHIHAPM